jgi:hypothetical protein
MADLNGRGGALFSDEFRYAGQSVPLIVVP